jgi:hypothetical protein
MTKKEIILEKALKKAKMWERGNKYDFASLFEEQVFGTYKYYAIIFSPDFAKAFWSEKDLGRTCHVCGGSTDMNGWRKHLQFMVIQDEPLKYLEKFLDD